MFPKHGHHWMTDLFQGPALRGINPLRDSCAGDGAILLPSGQRNSAMSEGGGRASRVAGWESLATEIRQKGFGGVFGRKALLNSVCFTSCQIHRQCYHGITCSPLQIPCLNMFLKVTKALVTVIEFCQKISSGILSVCVSLCPKNWWEATLRLVTV